MLFCLLAQKQWIKELGTGNMKTMMHNKYLFFKLAYIRNFVIDMKNLTNIQARHGGSWLLLRKMLRFRLAWAMLCSRHCLKTLKDRKGERKRKTTPVQQNSNNRKIQFTTQKQLEADLGRLTCFPGYIISSCRDRVEILRKSKLYYGSGQRQGTHLN